MIFRAVGFEEVDSILPAKSPETPRAKQIDPTPKRHGHEAGAEFQGFGVYLTTWIAYEPCLMPVSVQPINLQTRAILLAAPTAAALYVENIHVDPAATAITATLSSGAAFFENVIVDRIYGLKRLAGYFRTWHADPKCFLHAYHQLERIDGIQTETVGSEKRKIVSDLFGGNLQHQIFYEHLFDTRA
jgi:hypothetical protein